MTNELNTNMEVTDNRRINIVFHFPVFRFKAVSMIMTQKDFITIYRQLRSEKLKTQIKKFIEELDTWSEYDTDIEGQQIKRIDLMNKGEREITKFEDKIIR